MIEMESFLKNLIDNQRKAIKYHVVFAISVLGFGIIIILLGSLSSGDSISLKTIIRIVGGFISSMSAFPIKEIINRIEKMGLFRSAIPLLQSTDKEKVEEMLFKVIEKNL